ncbi:MAG: ATP-binding protein [Planctomycetota bacterium]
MISRLKGYLGDVPVRLIATVFVAILIPSLVVTGLGVVAVFQADDAVKLRERTEAQQKLQNLSLAVVQEWTRRFRYYREEARDAHWRERELAKLRSDPYVLEVFFQRERRVEPVAQREPALEIEKAWTDSRLEFAREREASTDEIGGGMEVYSTLVETSMDLSVEVESLLGVVRTARSESVRSRVDILDRALQLVSSSVDETGVPLRIPILIERLKLLGEYRSRERDATIERLVAAFKEHRDHLSEPAFKHLLSRARGLAKESKALARLKKAPEELFSSYDLTQVSSAFREELKRRRDPEDIIAFRCEIRRFGECVFASFPADQDEVFVHLLLDRDRFLSDIEVYLDDLDIRVGSVDVLEGAVSAGAAGESSQLATLTLPRPFEHLRWEYAHPTDRLPAEFRMFDVITAATFSWAVIILVLTILVGTFLTLRSVFREMTTAKMKTDFVSFISHELKTPLSAIRMFSETLLDRRVTDPDQATKCVELIDRESARLEVLIDRVLEFSQIQSRQKVFEFHSCSMAEVVEEAVRIFHEHNQGNPREIEIQSIQHISKIMMDRAAMVELVLNLLSNAHKYSKSGTKIIVRMRETITDITLEVVDQGVGIRKRDQRRIFDRFFRADDLLTRDAPGYGLGLAFARYIAREHKGDIKVSSQVNSGSTFALHLKKTNVLAE